MNNRLNHHCIVLLVTFLVFSGPVYSTSFTNNYERVLSDGDSVIANVLASMFTRSCMYGFGITGMSSEYHKSHKDRLWRVRCSRVSRTPRSTSCNWTLDFVNNYWERVKYRCPDGQYIAGIYSDYNTTFADRIWRFECCSNSHEVQRFSCVDTNYLNTFEGRLDLNLPPGQLIHGITSSRDINKSDRRWKFRICTTKQDFTN